MPMQPKKLNNQVVAFDVDGTLIHEVGEYEDSPRAYVMLLLIALVNLGCDVVVWSQGGVSYAEEWVGKLGISHMVRVVEKNSIFVDIAVDNESCISCVFNLRV